MKTFLLKRFLLLHKSYLCYTPRPSRVVRNPTDSSSLLTKSSEEQPTQPPNADSAWAGPCPPTWAPPSDLLDVQWADMYCAFAITLPSVRLHRQRDGWRTKLVGQERPEIGRMGLVPTWSRARTKAAAGLQK